MGRSKIAEGENAEAGVAPETVVAGDVAQPVSPAVAIVVTPPETAPIAADEVLPEPPTAPRPMSVEGFELDEWGLPRAGPVRAASLAAANRTDPNIDPTGWERISAPASPKE